MAARRRRSWLVWVLLALFVLVPLVEIYVIIQIGQVIGAWWTIVLLIADSLLGSWLIKREGGRAWRALRESLGSGRMPARELSDAGLILVGGTLMLAPGFVTDAFGVLMILPVTRPVFRRLLARVVAARVVSATTTARRPGVGPQGPTVRGEVIDDDRP